MNINSALDQKFSGLSTTNDDFQENLTDHLSVKGADLFFDSVSNSVRNKLTSSLEIAENYLTNFAHNSSRKQTLDIIYGQDYNQSLSADIINNWGNGNFSQTPKIEVLPHSILSGALGAFSSDTGKIYLNSNLVNNSITTEIVDVILEEIGHYLDAKINKFDTAGDEGNIFVKLVKGEAISLNDLNNLKLEDDHNQINLKGTIINIEQALPILNITANDSNAGETKTGTTANPGQFTLTRSGSTAGGLTVNYTVSGTATKGVDYNNLTGSVTFTSGASTALININPLDDSALESNETVILTLNNSSAYSLGTNTTATVTILDNDKSTISISANDDNAGETKTGTTANPGQFTLTRTGNLASSLTANYTIGGTATKGTDYNNLTGTVTFASGASTVLININPLDDSALEENETVILTLTGNSAYNLGTNTTATVTITDNDKPTISISANDSNAGETKTGTTANPGQFTLTRTGNLNSSLIANYTIGGTATKGTDYNNLTGTVTFASGASTALININPIDDSALEENETVILTLTGNSAYNLGTNNSATVTIADNDKPIINISAKDDKAGETKTGTTANPGQFTLTRTGNIASSLTANYTIGGTATNGADYNNLTGAVTFAAGASTALININPIDDSALEDSENVILTLSSNNAYNLGTNTMATVTITDNDKPIININSTATNAAETLQGQTIKKGKFTLTRTNNISSALTVNYTIGGTATKGIDYNNLTGTATFAAGASTAIIDITPIDDNLIEGTENVALTLNSSSAYGLGTKTSASVILADNDPIISVLATDDIAGEVNTGETANTGVFTLKRTGATTNSLTVNYTLTGSATKGTDYNNLTGAVTFAAGSDTATITITPINDSLIEGNETVVLELSPSLNNTYSLDPIDFFDSIAIIDNDQAIINVIATDKSAREKTNAQTPNPGKFTLTRSEDLSNFLTVNYSLSGSSTNGEDYQELFGQVTFSSGSDTATVDINIIDDDLEEGLETVILTLETGDSYIVGESASDTIKIYDNEGLITSEYSLLVKLPVGTIEDQFRDFVQSDTVKALSVDTVIPTATNRPNRDLPQWRVLYFETEQDLNKAQPLIYSNGFAVNMEINSLALQTFAVPNDSRFNNLWGLNNNGQTGGTPDADIDAPEAWDIATGSNSVVVAVIDSGVDYTHIDLVGNIWQNSKEIFGNGVDDDLNGYIDDYYGYDFANYDTSPLDDNGHGTHVAGTIGARGNNNLGVIGVSPNVKIMSVKFLDAGGQGSMLDGARAINYAIFNGAKIINASFGSYNFSQLRYDAVSDANKDGVLIVAAAGNSGYNHDFYPGYPAAFDFPNVISVAATDHKDQLGIFSDGTTSDYGANTVDLGAPGINILSTLPGNEYGYESGTSMAAPHVSGAAALLLAQKPNLTLAELKNALLNNADSLASLDGKTILGRRLNVYNALASITNNGLTNPTLKGQYQNPSYVPGLAWDVLVQGNYAYLADREAGLRIIDVSNPSNPVLAGKYDTPGFALDVKIKGNYAYIADGNGGLQIVDVSNPRLPVLKKNFGGVNQQPSSYFTNAVEVEINGNYAYVLDSEFGLQVLDITNPINPVWKAFYNTSGQASDFEIQGNYAYIADGYAGLKVIDISNPIAPKFDRYYETPGYVSKLSVVGNYAYLADGSSGLQIINLANIYSPGNRDENSFTTQEDMENAIAGKYQTYGVAFDVKINGNLAYVIDQGAGLQILDISNPSSPFLRGKYDSSGLAYGVTFVGNLLYLADGEAGLKILQT